jgi:hypothetical protein
MKTLYIAVLIASIVCLSGCNEQLVDDQYPEIIKSERYTLGQFVNTIDLSNVNAQVTRMVIGSLCEMKVEISRFGQNSIKIEPKSIACKDTQVVTDLNSISISDAYIDTTL